LAAAVVQLRSDSEPSTLEGRLRAIVGRLGGEADRRVTQRTVVEQRWIEDLTQYQGRYDKDTEKNLTASGPNKSKLFVNKTRSKTNNMIARLGDMLFPTDDRNWGIQPTPVPELSSAASDATMQAGDAAAQAQAIPDEHPAAPMADAQAQAVQDAASKLKAIMDEAKKRADAMQAEIEDQLRESAYNIEAREVIRDGCILGTGVIKGPHESSKPVLRWQKGPEGFMLQPAEPAVGAFRVDPWQFFPDPDAAVVEDSDSFYERHIFTAKQVRALAKVDGFNVDGLRRLLKDKPKGPQPSYLSDLRSITGQTIDPRSERYIVWEYHGPLTAEDMADIADMLGQDAPILGDFDPLQEVQGTVWFCQGEVLRFGIHPLDSGDPLYSVWNYEKDDTNIFGFGLPYIARDPQKAINSAWRMMMDNAGWSVAPQVVIAKENISPADGDYRLKAGKVWEKTGTAPAGQPAFEVYNITSNQPQLAGIIEMAEAFFDEEVELPLIAQGEQGASAVPTLGGMSMLMNSANVGFRRRVKNWDDQITTPLMGRFYHWNMQFSKKDYIKGDFNVDARGTSVLLVREMQATNLMAAAANFSVNPVLGPLHKFPSLLRKLYQAQMISADDIVKTDEELKQEAANATPQKPPEAIKAEQAMESIRLKGQIDHDLASYERDTKLMLAAEQRNMSLDDLKAKLAQTHMQNDSKERIMASEAAVSTQQGPHGGGYF
jgi:hypothetical protein